MEILKRIKVEDVKVGEVFLQYLKSLKIWRIIFKTEGGYIIVESETHTQESEEFLMPITNLGEIYKLRLTFQYNWIEMKKTKRAYNCPTKMGCRR